MIFEQCLALPGVDRGASLAKACEGDEQLLAEVRSLLEAEADADGFGEPPALRAVERPAADDDGALLERVGPYRLERVIGAGGMGTVYLATRTGEGFEQRVALKLIKRGMDTEEILARFKNERSVLAQLEHPGIAHLIDGGSTADGRPYLVMEIRPGPRSAWI